MVLRLSVRLDDAGRDGPHEILADYARYLLERKPLAAAVLQGLRGDGQYERYGFLLCPHVPVPCRARLCPGSTKYRTKIYGNKSFYCKN